MRVWPDCGLWHPDDREAEWCHNFHQIHAPKPTRRTECVMDEEAPGIPEHIDRAMYVTEQVKLWIANDGDRIKRARIYLGKGLDSLAGYLMDELRSALPYSAPRRVAQELAPNDYYRIHWSDVADEIREED